MPYAFEKRIMAHLRALLNENPFTDSSRMLWRAVAPCLGVMLLAIVLAFGRGDSNETEPLATVDPPVEAPDQNAIDPETVLLASFDDLEYTWQTLGNPSWPPSSSSPLVRTGSLVLDVATPQPARVSPNV